jgi:LPXTG-motif cell wall-anchored protein
LSNTLMKHIRVLVVGVALVALILAMAPAVANAKTDVGGKVNAALKGDGGGDRGKGDGRANDLQGKAEGALKGEARSNHLGDTNLNSDTNTDQRVDLNDPPLIGGDTKSITEVNSDLVPANGEAKADGNIVADGLVDEGLCVRGALNQSASGCGGGGTTGGTDNDNDNNGSIDLGELLDADNTSVDSDTVTDQRLDDDPLQSIGNTTSSTDVGSDAIPASATVEGNGNVEAPLLNQGVDVCGTLNAENCADGDTSAPGSGGPDGIDPGELLDADNTSVDSTTDVTETIDPNDPSLDGAVKNGNDVEVPLPISGTVEVAGNGTVGDTLRQAVNSCTDVNADGCAGGSDTSTPDNGGPVDGDPGDSNNPAGDNDSNNPAGDSDSNNPADDSDSSSGDGGTGGESSDGESTDSNDGNVFGSGFPLLGRLLDSASDSSSGDSGDELAFAAPADNSGSSDSGSDNSGSANNGDEPASAANPSDNSTQPLAANPLLGSSIQPLATNPFSDTMVALSAGPSEGGGKASASSGSATKSDSLPDTGGITPLVLVAGLLFIGGGLLLVTKRRRRYDS